MRFTSRDGLCSSADPAAVATWDQIGARMDREQADATALLRAQGVKAEHPDDGWVNREKNRCQLVYPAFNDDPQVGDLIALGWPWKGYRIVRVTRIERGGVLIPTTDYYFEAVARPRRFSVRRPVGHSETKETQG